jgi:hypothetical protein
MRRRGGEERGDEVEGRYICNVSRGLISQKIHRAREKTEYSFFIWVHANTCYINVRVMAVTARYR